MDFNHLIGTAGEGLWSNEAKNVQLQSIEVPYINKEETFGELRVYFDTAMWDISKDGLIYTDDHFLKALQTLIMLVGMSGSDVSYSEQGMQGEDYVSLDVGPDFIKTWKKINGI